MGWDLPGAIGAACAERANLAILITGDGSIQFNVQELMTVVINQLNLKIFVLNNDGYESIRSTQRNYFEGRFLGSDFSTGIGNPNFAYLAKAYNLDYDRIDNNAQIDEVLNRVLGKSGPALIELNISPSQGRTPRVTSVRREDGTFESKPLHDMFPFLPEEEVRANMELFLESP
jgi:acetolactate synthase-1/2/3 large subunit